MIRRRKKGSMKITAIVPSAGRGTRFKSREKKPFVNLNRKPVLWYTLKTLQSSPLINDIVLVMDGSLLKAADELVTRYRMTKVKHIVKGGGTRSDSVKKGLRWVDKDTSLIMIHDGVRPFASRGLVKRTVSAALKFGASVPAIPVRDTIKVSGRNSFVKYTPPRKDLREVQTPQVFKRVILEDAYKKMKRNGGFTDDASLVEKMGKRVKIVNGECRNIKITTVEDVRIAEVLLRNRE
jgi:2-C-methyl-D-erythritol 4-phosphate cytidylyltransferase